MAKVRISAQLPDELIAVHSRHEDIADNEVGMRGPCHL